MGGNGGASSGGGDGGSNGVQPQGTEYTLQGMVEKHPMALERPPGNLRTPSFAHYSRVIYTGVMRFLQTEWHRHERDRNAWEIERAEMKSKIGKLEGEGRTSKLLQKSLSKHVKMLEHVLKQERAKAKAAESGDKMEDGGSVSKKLAPDVIKRERPQPNGLVSVTDVGYDVAPLKRPHNSFLDTENSDDPIPSDLKQDTEREKSRVYLGKCIQEVTYHVVPTTNSHQQMSEEQEQILQNHQPPYQQGQGQSLEDVYVQQRQKQQNSGGILLPSPSPNHQPPPIPRISDVPNLSRSTQSNEQASYMSRSLPEQQAQSQGGPLSAIDTRNQLRGYNFPPIIGDQVEKISHVYDSYGRPISTREAEENSRITEEPEAADTDGWNFDDPSEPPNNEEQPPQREFSFTAPQRPDTDAFPNANTAPLKSPPRGGPGSQRRKSSLSRRRQSDGSHELREFSNSQSGVGIKAEASTFKVRFALRGHLDVVRSVIFTGGGSPSEPEICTTGDDGVIKRWIIPAGYGSFGASSGPSGNDLDISSYFTHRGHTGAVMALAACPATQTFSNGGRAVGDGWVFSGGQDATVRVWERGRVDPKATLDGHTDAVWTVCVLPGSSALVLGDQCSNHGGPERAVLASGSADGTILVWTVSAPPQLASPQHGSRRGAGGSRRANSVSSGSNFPTSPQPSTATLTPFHYSLVHRIERADHPSPTCISPLSMSGDSFVVSFTNASVLLFDTRTGEEVVGMASLETYDSTPNTGVNSVVATTVGLDGTLSFDSGRGVSEDESVVHGPTGSSSGVEGMILSGHEDRYIRFFDANSGMYPFPPPPIISPPSHLPMHSFIRSFATPLTPTHRSMHLQHARAPRRHRRPLPLARRPRTRLGRPRRQLALLVAREALLRAGTHQSSAHARGRRVRRRVEPGWPLGR